MVVGREGERSRPPGRGAGGRFTRIMTENSRSKADDAKAAALLKAAATEAAARVKT